MGSILGGDTPQVKIPAPPPPVRLSQPEDPEFEKQRLRLAEKRKGRRGRKSTLLTDVTTARAGGTPGGSKLGVG